MFSSAFVYFEYERVNQAIRVFPLHIQNKAVDSYQNIIVLPACLHFPMRYLETRLGPQWSCLAKDLSFLFMQFKTKLKLICNTTNTPPQPKAKKDSGNEVWVRVYFVLILG